MAAALDADAVRAYMADRLPAIWGARVDARMTALRMRNVQVAVRAATTPQTVSKVRAGELMPRDYLKVMIAAALATDVDSLFPLPTPAELAKAMAKTKKRVA